MGDVAGAKADHIVARLSEAFDETRKIFGFLERHRVPVPAGLEPGHKVVPVRAGNRLLTGSIDRSNDHRVGIVEAGAELVEQ